MRRYSSTRSSGRRGASQQRVTTSAAIQTATRASDHLTERLASIEQLVQAQQARIAEQELELTRLRTALAAPDTTAAFDATSAKPKNAGMQTSRRALLMAGGTVAAIAAFEVATSHAPVAQAHGANASNAGKAALGGVAWQTGTVSADEETLVKPSSAGYPSNDMLQVQLGTGTIYQAVPLKAAITAYDTTTNNIGVYATSSTGYGLYGVTNSGNGATGAGLSGTANTGVGVAGMSAAGIAVSGNSTTGLGGSFTGGQAPIALGLSGSAGAPTTGSHVGGEVFGDVNGELWVCVASGSPGSWTKVAHLAPGATSGGAITYLSKPIRLLDTRSGATAAHTPGSPYLANTTHTISVAGLTFQGVQVPATCAGAIGNLTVLGLTGQGNWVTLTPAGAGFSGTSNINFVGGQLDSNFYNVGLTGGSLDVIMGVGTNNTGGNANIILDLYAVIS